MKNASLYVYPSVEIKLQEPLIIEVSECYSLRDAADYCFKEELSDVLYT